jgi:RimJ/RimL family protein N-acetyltransferase
MIAIRQAEPAADFPRIAELLSSHEPEPVTAEQLWEWERRMSADRIRRRLVAVASDGAIVGYGYIDHETWMRPGRFELWALVDPARRGAGIGAALYDHAQQLAVAHGATSFGSEVRDDDPASLRFAERRGFRIDGHTFESILDLTAFDDQRFAGAIEVAEATGIRFFTMADLGDTAEAKRKLYELNRRTALDNPSADGTFAPFEEFQQFVFGASWYRPDGQILAADGERWVGIAAVAYYPERNSAYNAFTGVERDYRGRGLAQALKLLAIRFAQRYGAAHIRTNNDSQNAPMLAINRKLGYRPEPGRYRLVNDAETSNVKHETELASLMRLMRRR